MRRERTLYVDKTRFLHELERERFAFLIRPRRFGKSCWVALLESYYDRNRADRFEAIFGGTEIARQPTRTLPWSSTSPPFEKTVAAHGAAAPRHRRRAPRRPLPLLRPLPCAGAAARRDGAYVTKIECPGRRTERSAQACQRTGVPIMDHRSQIVRVHLPVLRAEALGQVLTQGFEVVAETLLAPIRLQHPVDVQEDDPQLLQWFPLSITNAPSTMACERYIPHTVIARPSSVDSSRRKSLSFHRFPSVRSKITKCPARAAQRSM